MYVWQVILRPPRITVIPLCRSLLTERSQNLVILCVTYSGASFVDTSSSISHSTSPDLVVSIYFYRSFSLRIVSIRFILSYHIVGMFSWKALSMIWRWAAVGLEHML